METKTFRWPDAVLAALCGGLTFAVCMVFAARGIDPHHDGVMLKTASDVAAGLALYRETFTQYGSFVIYCMALFVRLFGETVLAVQAATAVAYAVSAALLYAIVRRYAPRIVAFFAPLFAIGLAAFYFWNFHPWSSVFALALSLAACLAMIRYTETRRILFALLSGACCALMFWCRTPAVLTLFCGALYLCGLLLAGAETKTSFLKAFGMFALGAAIVFAAFLLVIVLQGALRDWWTQSVTNAFSFAAEPTAETAARQPDNLFVWLMIGENENPRYDWIWRVLTHGSLFVCIVLLVLVFRKKRMGGQADASLLGLLCFTAFMLFNWPHYYPTLCYRHVFWADYGLVGVLASAIYALTARLVGVDGKRRRALAAAVTLAALFALFSGNLLVRARLGKARLTGGGTGASFRTVEVAEEDTVHRYARDDYPFLNGLYLSARETRFYDGLFDTMAALQSRWPEKNVVNLTQNALFSMFSHDNVHTHAFALTADGYPEQTQQVADYIATDRPIVLSAALLDGYVIAAYLTDYNGDFFRFEPMYVLVPAEEK